MTRALPPELVGLSEAEDFFEALGVPYEPRVLAAHRLQVMRLFGLQAETWHAARAATSEARRAALARALREAHAAFAAEEGPRARNPFAPGLVQLRRR